MKYDIQYDTDQDCIFATFNGRVSMSVVREYIAALLPILEETDCRRLLSDSREADIHLTSSDIMQFPKLAAESPLTAQLKRAVLATPGTSGYELYDVGRGDNDFAEQCSGAGVAGKRHMQIDVRIFKIERRVHREPAR